MHHPAYGHLEINTQSNALSRAAIKGSTGNIYGTYCHQRDNDGLEGKHVVHAEGVPLLSSQTLCGHIGRLDITWTETKKPVTCSGCFAVIDQVKRRGDF